MLSASPIPDAFKSSARADRGNGTEELKKKRKKKRSHDEANPEERSEHREKKKKKKERKQSEASEDSRGAPALASALNAVFGDAPPSETTTAGSEKEKKHKKKKKDKGKKVDAPPAPQFQLDAEDEERNRAATTTLLNAIAAAVAGGTPAGDDQLLAAPELAHLISPPIGHPEPNFLPGLHPSTGFPPPPGFVEAPFIGHIPPHLFNELAYSSTDDVIRILSDLDPSKLADVLKSLTEAAAAANVPPPAPSTEFPPPPAFLPRVLEATPAPSLRQVPIDSGTILGRPARASLAPNAPPTTPDSSVLHHQTNQNHAEILCTKWMSTNKLAELVKTEGLVYKKGKFSATEDAQLAAAIEAYRTAHQLSSDQVTALIFLKDDKNRNKDASKGFWETLTRAVPQRPINAVYHHVKRIYHPLKSQGAWSSDEDGRLRQAVADLGQQWEKVSERVGRMSSDCRDRWRNHVQGRDVRTTGAWSKEEEEQLTRIVTDMTIKQGRDIDNDVFWTRVSQEMGGKRGRQQCRIKWTDSLSKIVKSGDQKARWNQQDAYILVHKVDSMSVNDDTEIDWKLLPDPDWNLWSAHTLQRRWTTMKKSVKGYEDMTHQEIMDILRVKKSHAPAESTANGKKRKNRKVVSSEVVPDRTVQPGAGSSTGPGTLAGGMPSVAQFR